MINIFVKGNFLVLIDAENHFFIDNLENCLLSKENDTATSYNLVMRGVNRPFVGIAFTDIADENDDAYASQSVFEEYIYQNTGVRVLSSGSGSTDLTYTASPTNGVIASSTGTDATIPLADGTNAGLLTPAEKTKLSNTSGTNSGDQDLSGLVPYSGATTDVDLGANILTAESFKANGTAGAGHLHLRHQSADATAGANNTAIFADTNGDIKYKNDGNYYTTLKTSLNTADRVYTFQDGNGIIAFLSDISGSIIPEHTPHETFRGVSYRNNSTTEDTFGGITISTTGSATARSVATTNYATKQVRKGFVASVVSSGRYTETRGSALLWYIGGGFRYVCDVYISDTAYASGCRQFYGMMGQTTSLTYSDTVLVDTMVNVIGFGSDSADTNIQVFHNDATGTCTKIDLGSSFPANRSAGSALTAMYSFELYNGYDGNVLYKAVNNETGASVEGTISTNLPLSTQGLNFVASRCMGGGGGTTNSGQFDLSILGVYSI